MAVTASTVKTIAPELACEKAARITFFLGMAERCVNRTVFDDKADDATALLAAHMLTLSNRGGAGGAITSEKVGDLATSYSSGTLDKSKLCSTAYGSMFFDMMKVVRRVPFVVGC